MKKVLISGASGFIGANLTRRCIRDGFDVHLLLRQGYKNWRIDDIVEHCTTHILNFHNLKELQSLFKETQPQWVFHLAAFGAYSTQKNFENMVQTNIVATNHLLEVALEYDCESFINVGSSSEYGYKDHAPKEDEWIEPNSHYALTKSYGTMYCRHISLEHKVHFMTLRPYSIYGPFEEPKRLIPTIIINGIKGTLPPLVSPQTGRDFVFVDDFVDACIVAANSKPKEFGKIYNVGSQTQTTLEEVVTLIKDLFPIKDKPQWGSMERRIWDTNVWVSDSSKIHQELKWQAHHHFKEGIQKTIQWFQENPSFLDLYKKSILGDK